MTPKPYDPEAALDEFREKIFDGAFQAADPTAELENQVKWLRAALDEAYRAGHELGTRMTWAKVTDIALTPDSEIGQRIETYRAAARADGVDM